MLIVDGYTDLPSGKIASVVTYLEMLSPPQTPPVPPRANWNLRRHTNPDLTWYRRLFRAVGEEWLWFSRLQMTDAALRAIVHDAAVDVFSFEVDGVEKGILEVDRREMPDIEIAFIGLMPDAIGIGAGKYLLDQAIRIAWSHNPRRLCVHTCTLDHPRALGMYRSAGFIPYRRAIEIADDPRLSGVVSPRCAWNHPVLTDLPAAL